MASGLNFQDSVHPHSGQTERVREGKGRLKFNEPSRGRDPDQREVQRKEQRPKLGNLLP
jgi:hypothetical protein